MRVRKRAAATILVLSAVIVLAAIMPELNDLGSSGQEIYKPGQSGGASSVSHIEGRGVELLRKETAGELSPEVPSGTEPIDAESVEGPEGDLRRRLFLESHKGLSRDELRGIRNELRVVHDELRDELYESEKLLGLYQEVIFQYDPAGQVRIPKPEDLPAASYVQQVISPGEDVGVEGVGRVWYVTLTREEYPDLYQLRDELNWLEDLMGN